MLNATRLYIALGLIVFLLFLPGRASLPPLDRDEPRYMQATTQMLESGNWIDVRFQDHPRYLQPAGIYWLEAIAVKATGTLESRSVWGYRVPTLLSVCLSALITMYIGNMLFGLPAAALAAAFLATSVLLTAEGRMATIDTTLLVCVLLVESALVKAWQNNALPTLLPLRTAILYWGAIGVGLMLKGPVILIPAFGTPLALFMIERQNDWWRHLRPKWGWLLTLLIALPWCMAITIVSHGDFFSHSLGRNFFGKVASGQEAHGLPPGYHLGILTLGFWPGSLFLAIALPFIWINRYKAETRFLVCWIVPHWLVFEAIATKLPHYVLPVYPALAILTASAFTHMTSWKWPHSLWGRALLGLYCLIWLCVGSALACAGPFLLWQIEHIISLPALLTSIGSIPLLFATLWFVKDRRMWQAAASAIGAAIIIYTGLFLTTIPRLTTIWLSPRLANAIEDIKTCPEPPLASASYSEPSLVFLTGGHIKLISPSKTADFLVHHQECGLALVDKKDMNVFLNRLEDQHIAVREKARVAGLNYSTGKSLDIGIYQVAPTAPQ